MELTQAKDEKSFQEVVEKYHKQYPDLQKHRVMGMLSEAYLLGYKQAFDLVHSSFTRVD
jgi:hypothetical protein